MKVLFVAYYFEPFTGVGAKRISYWAKYVKKLDKEISKCDVITATPQKNAFEYIDNVFYIKNTNQGLLRKIIRYDKGASWLYDLKKYINDNIQKNDYDCVVLTGDPFLHFFIISYFKKIKVKTILDFRDPFANNPRGLQKNNIVSYIKSFILRKIENYFLYTASHVISVNEYCAQMFENYKNYKSKVSIIDNGYDEELFKNIINVKPKNIVSNTIKFTYAGKLYFDRNPQRFFQCLKEFKNIEFYHIGEQSEYIKEETDQIHSLGFMSYQQTLEILSTMDVCTVFTSGHNFESTTKIFDYMALNKTILIITDSIIQTGQLHNITKNYPSIYWAKNTYEDINSVLETIENKLKNFESIEFDSYPYSRKYGLKKLIKIIKDKNE